MAAALGASSSAGAALGCVADTAAAALGTGTEVQGISIPVGHASLENIWEIPVRRGGRRKGPDVRRAPTLVP